MISTTHIKKMRKSKRLSQKDLADSANIEPRVVKQIESGKIKQNSDTIKRICHALGLQVEEFLELPMRENNNYIIIMYPTPSQQIVSVFI